MASAEQSMTPTEAAAELAAIDRDEAALADRKARFANRMPGQFMLRYPGAESVLMRDASGRLREIRVVYIAPAAPGGGAS